MFYYIRTTAQVMIPKYDNLWDSWDETFVKMTISPFQCDLCVNIYQNFVTVIHNWWTAKTARVSIDDFIMLCRVHIVGMVDV